MSVTVIGPQVKTLFHPDKEKVITHSASFIFNFKSLKNIADELCVAKSNEKSRTILQGFNTNAKVDIAKKLSGKRFLIDAQGRELPPAIGYFQDDTLAVVGDFLPTLDNEKFIEDLQGDNYESTRYKLMLKSILWFGRIIHVNNLDGRLILWEITTEPIGQGLIEAIFMGGAEERDYYVSLTETTNFKLEN